MARKVSEFMPMHNSDFDAGAMSSTFEGDADSNPGDDLDFPDDDFWSNDVQVQPELEGVPGASSLLDRVDSDEDGFGGLLEGFNDRADMVIVSEVAVEEE